MELSRVYKNKNGRYETMEGHELTCGCHLKFEKEEGLGELTEARVEHNGLDYYFFVSKNEKYNIYNGTTVLIDF